LPGQNHENNEGGKYGGADGVRTRDLWLDSAD